MAKAYCEDDEDSLYQDFRLLMVRSRDHLTSHDLVFHHLPEDANVDLVEPHDGDRDRSILTFVGFNSENPFKRYTLSSIRSVTLVVCKFEDDRPIVCLYKRDRGLWPCCFREDPAWRKPVRGFDVIVTQPPYDRSGLGYWAFPAQWEKRTDCPPRQKRRRISAEDGEAEGVVNKIVKSHDKDAELVNQEWVSIPKLQENMAILEQCLNRFFYCGDPSASQGPSMISGTSPQESRDPEVVRAEEVIDLTREDEEEQPLDPLALFQEVIDLTRDDEEEHWD